MKGLIFIENDHQNALLNDLKRYMAIRFSPVDYIITTNEGVFRRHLHSCNYENVIVIVESDLVHNYCKHIMFQKEVILQKLTIIRLNLTTVAVTSWQGSHRVETSRNIFGKKDFAIKYEELFEELFILNKDFIQVNVIGKGQHKVFFNEIIFMQGAGYNTLLYVTSNQILRVKLSQKKILSLLPDNFLKIHRSYSINSAHSLDWQNGAIMLRNGYSLPTSKTKDELVTLGVL